MCGCRVDAYVRPQVMGRHGALDEAFKHLTSHDPSEFWTSGQWMTERKGGSDVGLYVLVVYGIATVTITS